MKIIEIKCCGDCPESFSTGDNRLLCDKKNKRTDRKGDIPEWCPLKDSRQATKQAKG